jgi:predicted TIM-barrel fold metal-dependent hydrolase
MSTMTAGRPSFDLFGVLTTHGVFSRHPRLKTASIEAGSEWLPELVKKLKKVYGQRPQMFSKDPVEQLRQHLWIAPFYEDDIRGLVDIMGPGQILFGSDYPHAEGLADPKDFVNDLPGFSPEEIKAIMLDNARAAMAA